MKTFPKISCLYNWIDDSIIYREREPGRRLGLEREEHELVMNYGDLLR
jgi:hypothetical protein